MKKEILWVLGLLLCVGLVNAGTDCGYCRQERYSHSYSCNHYTTQNSCESPSHNYYCDWVDETCHPPVCIENWICGTWGTCNDGFQSRICTDSNHCDKSTDKPSTSRTCTPDTTTTTTTSTTTTTIPSETTTTTIPSTTSNSQQNENDNKPKTSRGDSGIGFVGCNNRFFVYLRLGGTYHGYTMDERGYYGFPLTIIQTDPNLVVDVNGFKYNLTNIWTGMSSRGDLNMDIALMELWNFKGGALVGVRVLCKN